jgi:uncharacterized repeat protein (TIGR02543 family)
MDANKTIYAKARLTMVYDQAWQAAGVGTPDVTKEYDVGATVDMSQVDGSVTWYEDAAFTKAITAPITMTENKTIYAEATISGGGNTDPVVDTTFTLTYNSNGGTEIAPRQFTEKTEVDFDDANYIPTREGYTFTGWYTEETLQTRLTGKVEVSADTTVYAGWEEKSKDPTEEKPKDTTEETPKDPTEETPKDTTDETPKDTTDETPKDTTDETPKDTTDETPKDTTTETPTDVTTETPKDTATETTKNTTKVTTNTTTTIITKNVDATTSSSSSEKTPETGDQSNLLLWVSLLLISSMGIVIAIVYAKKKKEE